MFLDMSYAFHSASIPSMIQCSAAGLQHRAVDIFMACKKGMVQEVIRLVDAGELTSLFTMSRGCLDRFLIESIFLRSLWRYCLVWDQIRLIQFICIKGQLFEDCWVPSKRGNRIDFQFWAKKNSFGVWHIRSFTVLPFFEAVIAICD